MSRLQSRRSDSPVNDLLCGLHISNRNTAWKNCNKGKIKLVYIHLEFHSKLLSLRKGLCTPPRFSGLNSTVPLNQPVLRDQSSTKQNRVVVVLGFLWFVFMSLPPFLCLQIRNTQAIWDETQTRTQESRNKEKNSVLNSAAVKISAT